MTPAAVDKKAPFPFLDLKAQFASIREEVLAAVTPSWKASNSFSVPK